MSQDDGTLGTRDQFQTKNLLLLYNLGGGGQGSGLGAQGTELYSWVAGHWWHLDVLSEDCWVRLVSWKLNVL